MDPVQAAGGQATGHGVRVQAESGELRTRHDPTLRPREVGDLVIRRGWHTQMAVYGS